MTSTHPNLDAVPAVGARELHRAAAAFDAASAALRGAHAANGVVRWYDDPQ